MDFMEPLDLLNKSSHQGAQAQHLVYLCDAKTKVMQEMFADCLMREPSVAGPNPRFGSRVCEGEMRKQLDNEVFCAGHRTFSGRSIANHGTAYNLEFCNSSSMFLGQDRWRTLGVWTRFKPSGHHPHAETTTILMRALSMDTSAIYTSVLAMFDNFGLNQWEQHDWYDFVGAAGINRRLAGAAALHRL